MAANSVPHARRTVPHFTTEADPSGRSAFLSRALTCFFSRQRGRQAMTAQATHRQVNILAISDKVESLIYSGHIRGRFEHIDLVLSCGDLPCYYLEYIVSMLDVPLYYVNGNHAPRVEYGTTTTRRYPWGAVNLHGKVINHAGLLIAGFEGSRRYNNGPHQYTEMEMRLQVARI